MVGIVQGVDVDVDDQGVKEEKETQRRRVFQPSDAYVSTDLAGNGKESLHQSMIKGLKRAMNKTVVDFPFSNTFLSHNLSVRYSFSMRLQ